MPWTVRPSQAPNASGSCRLVAAVSMLPPRLAATRGTRRSATAQAPATATLSSPATTLPATLLPTRNLSRRRRAARRRGGGAKCAGERRFACITCAQTFLLSSHLRAHIASTHDRETFPCRTCGLRFRWKSSCYTHEHSAPSEERAHHCTMCQMQFKTRQTLVGHSKHTHPDFKPYKCACGTSFATLTPLRAHARARHPPALPKRAAAVRPRDCAACGETFPSASRLRDHQRAAHPTLRPFACGVCGVCGASFAKRHVLQVHQAVRSTARPFACAACGRTFKTAATLATHKLASTTTRQCISTE